MAALSACSRKRATRYKAWLFMASASEKAVVVADLADFRRSGSIPLESAPHQVLSAHEKLYALCPASQAIIRIDPVAKSVLGRIPLGGDPIDVALTSDGAWLAVALRQPPSILLINTATDQIIHRTALPVAPNAIAATGRQVAVVLGSTSIGRMSVPDGALLGTTPLGTTLTAISYRKDSGTIFAAAPDARQVISLDATSGAILARLPVPIRPARFCVDGSGGQVFITGAEGDAQLVIFEPYQNEIDQTLYAGHAPFGMAVAPVRNLLFLSNPAAGGITILDIAQRKRAATIRTGGTPREILIETSSDPTKEEEYAFVVDGDSGDVTVIHIPAVLHQSGDAFIAEPPKPIFAVFRGGGEPQSAIIVPYSA